jgi:hypothetical protein
MGCMGSKSVDPQDEQERRIEQKVETLHTALVGGRLEEDEPTPHQILDHIFLGNLEDARNINKLEKYQINYILNMMEDATTDGKNKKRRKSMTRILLITRCGFL